MCLNKLCMLLHLVLARYTTMMDIFWPVWTLLEYCINSTKFLLSVRNRFCFSLVIDEGSVLPLKLQIKCFTREPFLSDLASSSCGGMYPP